MSVGFLFVQCWESFDDFKVKLSRPPFLGRMGLYLALDIPLATPSVPALRTEPPRAGTNRRKIPKFAQQFHVVNFTVSQAALNSVYFPFPLFHWLLSCSLSPPLTLSLSLCHSYYFAWISPPSLSSFGNSVKVCSDRRSLGKRSSERNRDNFWRRPGIRAP